MRIVIASTATAPGGVWRHVRDLACGLAERGHDVRLGLRSDATELQQASSQLGLPWLGLARSLTWRPDVWHLHLHDTYDPLAAPCLVSRRGHCGVTIVTEHLPRTDASDPTLLPGPRTIGAAQAKWLLKRLHATLTDRLIAVGAASQHFLCVRYSLTRRTVRLVQCGIGPVPAATTPPRREDYRVVVVGGLHVQKGHDVLVKAAACSRRPWNVTVVGAGPARARLERLAHDIAPGRVRFSGWQEDAGPAMAAADVVCIPSRWESFPYVALEAGALGRPVVASAVDALPEIVCDEQTGRLVPPDDPESLAAALDDLAANPALGDRLGQAGRERVQRLFPLERMIEGNLAVYRDATNG